MKLPGMGGGTCALLLFHGPKLGPEGRLVFRPVRPVRERAEKRQEKNPLTTADGWGTGAKIQDGTIGKADLADHV